MKKENLEKLVREEIGDFAIMTALDTLNWDWYDYIEIDVVSDLNSDNREYRIIPESIIERVFEESARDLIDDCIIPELPEMAKRYFDYDSMINDMSMDWYGHHFNGYDWTEIQGNGLYLFRNN